MRGRLLLPAVNEEDFRWDSTQATKSTVSGTAAEIDDKVRSFAHAEKNRKAHLVVCPPTFPASWGGVTNLRWRSDAAVEK